MKACDEEKLLGHLGVVLYEYLGEEYPEVLGSILAALKVRACASAVLGASNRVEPPALVPQMMRLLSVAAEVQHLCSPLTRQQLQAS